MTFVPCLSGLSQEANGDLKIFLIGKGLGRDELEAAEDVANPDSRESKNHMK